MSKNLRRHRQKIDVRTIKKHSDIVKTQTNSLSVGGVREKTSYGYQVTGFKGKSFETKYEVMLSGTSTNLLYHPKKDRVIRILSGTGFAIFSVENDSGATFTQQQKIMPGDEIVFERGTKYRIATTSNEDLVFLVTQSAKYEASLQVLLNAEVTKEVADDLLREPVRQPSGETHRRGSRAKEQLSSMRQQREAAAKEPKPVSDPQHLPESANRDGLLNPKPTGGNLDEVGAG